VGLNSSEEFCGEARPESLFIGRPSYYKQACSAV
jgi:hypothetical protein